MQNSLFIDAAFSRPVDRPPVWLMRQAGRYMKEYRAIKEKHTFLEMCRTPEIAADITMLPVDLLGIDAAIMFSDILRSEEHTSELQSLMRISYAVFCLKKKTTRIEYITHTRNTI